MFFIHINLYFFNSLDHHQILALTTPALVSLSGRIGTVAPFSFCSLVFGWRRNRGSCASLLGNGKSLQPATPSPSSNPASIRTPYHFSTSPASYPSYP
jgi:hypothetical protein